MKTDEEIGAEAARLAHKKVLQEAKCVRLTTKKVLKRIEEGLNAYETKVFYDRRTGKCIYSKKLINYTARAKSIDQAIVVLNMAPKEDLPEDIIPAQPVQVIIQVVDASNQSAGEQAPGPVSGNAE